MPPDVVARSLDQVLSELIGPLFGDDGLLPWRLVGWDGEQGVTLVFSDGPSALLVELEDHDEERDCYARTRRFNVCARHMFLRERPLAEEDRAVVDRVVAVVREREGCLPTERALTSRRAVVREILVERVLMREGDGHYYVNPYVGCTIGCEYCFVAGRADLSRRLEGLPHLPWGRFLDVKINAASVLRKEIAAVPPGIVRFSPILTDPYQPAERRYRVTRQCLEVLLPAGFTPVILTRSALVLDDLDLLAQFPRAAVGFSIPTDDDRVRRQFEPGADPIPARLDALERVANAGIPAFVAVQPMLPMDPAALVARTAPFVVAARVDRMHFLGTARRLYDEAGLAEAATDDFFERTGRQLREGFLSAGVPLDELDHLARLVGLPPDTPEPLDSRPCRRWSGSALPVSLR